MRKDFMEYLVEGIILLSIIVILIGFVLQTLDYQKDHPSQPIIDLGWNHGYCQFCERKYEFVQYTVHSDATYCLYECPSCGKAVEVPLSKKERRE